MFFGIRARRARPGTGAPAGTVRGHSTGEGQDRTAIHRALTNRDSGSSAIPVLRTRMSEERGWRMSCRAGGSSSSGVGSVSSIRHVLRHPCAKSAAGHRCAGRNGTWSLHGGGTGSHGDTPCTHKQGQRLIRHPRSSDKDVRRTFRIRRRGVNVPLRKTYSRSPASGGYLPFRCPQSPSH